MLKHSLCPLFCLLFLFCITVSASAHPATFPLPEDVNADGIVNIQDLVRVASAFGDMSAVPMSTAMDT